MHTEVTPQPILGVLFDLDGTLADTAPDLAWALNTLRLRYDRPALPLATLRPLASHGARGLLKTGFDLSPSDPFFEELRDEFLTLYRDHLCVDTRLFDGVSELLDALDTRHISWGIVTNKLTRFTDPLVQQLGLEERAQCIVSGDTYARPKPYPDPLQGAARELELPVESLLYLGDDVRDMQAAQAAGIKGVVARYGYLGDGPDPGQWPAWGRIAHPLELLSYLPA